MTTPLWRPIERTRTDGATLQPADSEASAALGAVHAAKDTELLMGCPGSPSNRDVAAEQRDLR
ncbi:hypothetical protein [Actinophytocola sp.]|uniref:hypothetical protein n=1 Tax=Actinophytocola sp. TaxID=1872138 RepID=UPI002DBAC5C7|nr:hypothetical protein [Actinophytocola sp.]